MKKISITGGSGFIGTNLIDCLISKGYEVQNLDKKPPLKDTHRSYWKGVDILDFESLKASLMAFQPDAIIHLAAVTDLEGTQPEYYRANTEGTQNIIAAAALLPKLKKILFTSSMYVCEPGYIPQSYDEYKPHTLYGESKVAGEKLVKNIQNPHYVWTLIRPTSIWGPWFGIPYIDFFKVVSQKKYFDFGKACTKTYGFIDNTTYQIHQLLISESSAFQTYYLGDDPPIPISEWGNEISIAMGKGPIRKVPYFILKLAALTGDLLIKTGIKFPISSFRLNNMTTNNILPLGNLYKITGDAPYTRIAGVKKTIKWLHEQNAFY
ncbi:nucleoside-diphosphate-sugar epimerase [Leeuwenhoekiella aestuarii]|uniref:NAD-dependent epimerase/dehydratase family protein n=1 Tax=Leeuwenhoekiella aestuarii TaxID=2249426 RepID=UPI000FFF029F|nr:NAD(P)-dependent oxidoreductase [Leeuwenhoekiella aestuarii]RXG12881.1 nucleoside-diphosphate-sugar epimerase [Leeuwenhoekiella aestuarii]